MISNDNPERQYTWAKIFIEVALRAIRRVHYNYNAWGMGHYWKKDLAEPYRMNTGYGIEYAHEPEVCAAIIQEFMSSPYTSGLIEENTGSTQKYWQINREEKYQGSNERADICLERFVKTGENENLILDGTTNFIEAKRAKYYGSDLLNGELGNLTRQHAKVRDDIDKLKKENKKRNGKLNANVLVWSDFQDENDSPTDFFKSAGLPLNNVHRIRWMPFKWDSPKEGFQDGFGLLWQLSNW